MRYSLYTYSRCNRFVSHYMEIKGGPAASRTDLSHNSPRLQGIPIGLTFGTIPFLLKPHVSYSQLALFSLSSWPYSLKLLYSPIVDAWFWSRLGRRKSWIVPVQLILAAVMWVVGSRVQGWIDAVGEPGVMPVAKIFWSQPGGTEQQESEADAFFFAMFGFTAYRKRSTCTSSHSSL